jgi:hypothetical protein
MPTAPHGARLDAMRRLNKLLDAQDPIAVLNRRNATDGAFSPRRRETDEGLFDLTAGCALLRFRTPLGKRHQ